MIALLYTIITVILLIGVTFLIAIFFDTVIFDYYVYYKDTKSRANFKKAGYKDFLEEVNKHEWVIRFYFTNNIGLTDHTYKSRINSVEIVFDEKYMLLGYFDYRKVCRKFLKITKKQRKRIIHDI